MDKLPNVHLNIIFKFNNIIALKNYRLMNKKFEQIYTKYLILNYIFNIPYTVSGNVEICQKYIDMRMIRICDLSYVEKILKLRRIYFDDHFNQPI